MSLLGLLKANPATAGWTLAALAAVYAGGFASGAKVAAWRADSKQAQVLEDHSQEKIRGLQGVIQAQAEEKRKADERLSNLQKANDEANIRFARSAADAASAVGALERLRQSEAARLARRGGVSATAAASCQCEADTQGSELFLRCAGRYAELGRRADAAYDAGKLCEASYDALSIGGGASRYRTWPAEATALQAVPRP